MRDVIQVERPDGTSAGPDSIAQLARVADELLPPLVARLGVSDLGEIEVRQGAWRVRIRRAGVTSETTTPVVHAPATALAAGAVATSAAADDQPVARSTAVGYFGVRPGLAVGHRVSRGDVVGWVDVLGVRMEIVAPADGVVGRFVTEPGDPVEYGQELVSLIAATGPAAAATGSGAAGASGTSAAASVATDAETA